MQKVELTVKGLSYSERQTGAYALLMAEVNGQRKLPIVIGVSEAQSIAIALEKTMNAPRPLTHDLFKSVLDNFKLGVREVVIHKMKDGIFFANLVITNANGNDSILDARPSDAVALAVRYNCPIYTTEEVLEKAGMILEDDTEKRTSSIPIESEPEETIPTTSGKEETSIEKSSLKDLNKMLNAALAKEDYELAARIRDEIEKRKK